MDSIEEEKLVKLKGERQFKQGRYDSNIDNIKEKDPEGLHHLEYGENTIDYSKGYHYGFEDGYRAAMLDIEIGILEEPKS